MNSTNQRSQDLIPIEVIIPAGVSTGDTINTQTGDGRTFAVLLPAGISVGQKLTVMIPRFSSIHDNNVTETVAAVETSSNSISTQKEYSSNAKTIGAAATAAVIGTLLIGPVTGIIVAGVAVYATTRNDKIGETTKAVGGATCAIYDKGNEVATKYQLWDKAKSAVAATSTKLNEINQEYHLTDKAYAAGSQALTTAKEIDAKYKISETATEAVVSGSKEIYKFVSSPSRTNTTPVVTATPITTQHK